MLRKPLDTRNAWYNFGRYFGDGFLWLSKKLKPERGTGNEDLDRVNNLYVDYVANQMTKEGIRELNDTTSKWQRYDYFDPAHPTQGVYGGRYAYNPSHNRNLPSDSMATGVGDAFMRGFRHEDVNGDFRFQDLQTGNIVQFTKENNPFQPKTTGKKLPPNYAPVLPETGGYRPSATFGVRRPGGSNNAAPYDPIAARAEATIRAMSAQRAQTARPQDPLYQYVAEPVILPPSQYAPPPSASYQNVSEPSVVRIETPGASYLRRKTTRPVLGEISFAGPIRRRARSRAVAQADPFDYVSHLSRLATLHYNF